MKILCLYAERQITSNTMMYSTIFNGLKRCGYHIDIVLLTNETVYKYFDSNFRSYFNEIKFIPIKKHRLFSNSSKFDVIYSFWLNFIKDRIIRPYKLKSLNGIVDSTYDLIISFCPPALSALFAMDFININGLNDVRYIQYWSDPLSLGRCNSVEDMPKYRILHYLLEKEAFKGVDEIIYCYPLLCEMQQQLHKRYAHKMRWVDVAYMEREILTSKHNNKEITLGFFGAYQSRVRNILPFLETLKFFPSLKFIIRGDTDLQIDSVDYPNLDIEFGRQPADLIASIESNCDILVSLGGLSGINHPAGKTMYYANYDKPIIYIGDGVHVELFNSYLKEFGRYIICENNVDSIYSGINTALNLLPVFKLNIHNRLRPENVALDLVLGKY